MTGKQDIQLPVEQESCCPLDQVSRYPSHSIINSTRLSSTRLFDTSNNGTRQTQGGVYKEICRQSQSGGRRCSSSLHDGQTWDPVFSECRANGESWTQYQRTRGSGARRTSEGERKPWACPCEWKVSQIASGYEKAAAALASEEGNQGEADRRRLETNRAAKEDTATRSPFAPFHEGIHLPRLRRRSVVSRGNRCECWMDTLCTKKELLILVSP
ncbi:hypothetical protein EDD17DRAFT_562269 [Pisolithus thermaeus]|nr:hypothetical protein EDD17DRAFT_562269 [Pisolithus thermaeus]